MSLHFTAKIEIRGINPYVLVTKDQAALLKPGWRKPLPVLVQVEGKPDPPWRINMMPVGDGSFYLYLHGSVRESSGKQVGDTATVDVAFDPEYRSGPAHPLPEWFGAALTENEAAAANWERLPPSRQKEVLRYFSAIKSPEAQERNLRRALEVLSGKSGRFMARSWKDGECH
jgi:hypothetical protein